MFLTKDKIEEEEKTYKDLSFFKKTKNVLSTFVLAMTALSLLLFILNLTEYSLGISLFVQWALYIILAIFIYFNHRWAMVIACLIYLSDKVLFILDGLGSPVSQIIFGGIMLVLTYNSFRVATVLKSNATNPENVF